MNINNKFLSACPYCGCSHIQKKWYAQKQTVDLTILWCKSCGFGWQHPYPSKNETENLYKNQGLYHEKIVSETQGGFQERIKKLNQLKAKRGRILDIGSGMGHFLNYAQNTGWIVEGVEPKLSASEYCSKNFGIKVHNFPFEEWSQNKTYDVITLWDVIEHVNNPFQFLNKSIDMLSSGGLLILSIPNASGFPARFFKGNWRYVMEPHINYFTMPFIHSFFKERGLEVLRAENSIKFQSIFEGIISLFPFKFDIENFYRMAYQETKSLNVDSFKTKTNIKKTIKKLIFKFNLISYPLPIGDLVDIYCLKP